MKPFSGLYSYPYRLGFTIVFLSIFILTTIRPLHSKPIITGSNGSVTVNDGLVDTGYKLKPGDVIATEQAPGTSYKDQLSDTAYVDIKLEDGHQFRAKSAKVRLKSLKKKINVELDKGLLVAHLNDRQKDGLKVYTGTAIAGVRGTKFYVHSSFERTYVCVMTGRVDVRKRGFFNQFTGERFTVNKGEFIKVPRAETAEGPVPGEENVQIGWDEFQKMGYTPPKEYR